jgi:hypothetical protein
VIGGCAIGLAVTGEWTAEQVGEFAERAASLWLRGDYEGSAYSPPVQAMLQPLLNALILCERFAVADAVLERAQREARDRGWLPELLQALSYGGTSAYRQGALAEGEADTRAAIALSAEHEERSYAFHCHTTLLLTLIEQRQLGEARAVLEQSGLDPFDDGGVDARWFLHARGRLRCADGPPRDGLDDLLAAGGRFERARQPCPTLAPWRSDAALAYL